MTSDYNVNIVMSVALVLFCTSFVFGWNQGVLNQPMHFIMDFFNSSLTTRHEAENLTGGQVTAVWATVNAIYVVGLFLGSLAGSKLAYKLGRIRSILVAQLFLAVGIALVTASKAANSVEMIFIGRFIIGWMCGIVCTIAPMYLAEVSTSNIRGALMTGHQLFVTFGIFIGSVFGLPQCLSTATGWPYLQLINASSFVLAGLLFIVPETPRYLLLVVGDVGKARAALSFYRRSTAIDDEMSKLDQDVKAAKALADKPFTVREMFSKKYRRPLFIAVFLQVVQQFSGVNAVFFYSNSIYKRAGVSDANIPYAVIGTNALNLVMTVIAVPLMDIAGRRILLIYPISVMIADMVVLVVMMAIQEHHVWASYVSIVCILVYVITFAIGLGPIPWMVGSELFRERPRPMVMSLACMMNFLGQFIIVIGFEPLERVIGCYIFVIFIILLAGFLVFIIIFVPETRHKTFEEIAMEMHISVDNE